MKRPSTLFERMSTIARGGIPRQATEIEDIPPAVPPPPKGPRNPGITDQEARIKNRALDRFRFWLDIQGRAKLERADPESLAQDFVPVPAEEIRLMIGGRLKRLIKESK